MREVGHAGKDINDRYTHVSIEAHLAAAELRASCALAARLPRSRAADGPERTGCTDGSVHEPVHGRDAHSLILLLCVTSLARPRLRQEPEAQPET